MILAIIVANLRFFAIMSLIMIDSGCAIDDKITITIILVDYDAKNDDQVAVHPFTD